MVRQTIPTPEGVPIEVELAGLGSRTVAFVLDLTVFLFGLSVLLSVANVVVLAIAPDAFAEFFTGFVTRFSLVAFLFLTLWGVAVWMDGSTPGKRALGLRVVGADGTPVNAWQHFVRTLALFADLFLFVGPILMFLSPRPLRLGDLIAGTIVVREGEGDVLLDPWLRQTWSGREARALELSPGTASRFDEAQLALLRDLILRQELEPEAARALYRDAADAYCARAGVEPTRDPRRALKDVFLFLREARGG